MAEAEFGERNVKCWKLVGWDKLDHGQVKLNTDGVAKGNSGLVSAGGLSVVRQEVR